MRASLFYKMGDSMKKINIYINGVYTASSNQFKTCSELKKHIVAAGGFKVRVLNGFKTVIINKNDTVRCSYK